MTQYTTGAELRGYHPGNTSTAASDADYIIPGGDIRTLDIEERAAEYKDQASITIDNDAGQYNVVTHGDRLEFYVEPAGATESADGYGEGGYGAGPYGGGGTTFERRWTGMVRNYTISQEGGGHYVLDITGEDFVYAVLGMRQIYDAFRNQKIVGTDGILNTILATEAPEIDRSLLPEMSVTTDISFSGVSLFDAVNELAARADSLTAARGTALLFQPPSALESEFYMESADTGLLEVESNDDNLVNFWRVDGGSATEMDDRQETVDGSQRVSDTNRITHQIDHPKSEVAHVEVWTRRTGSGDNVRVRLQKDDGGAPVEVENKKKDLARRTLDAEFLDDEGWTTFLMPENDTPGANPWLIIESDGSTGQDIGGNVTSDEPAFRAYYKYPVNVALADTESQDTYRERENRVKDDSLETFDEAELTGRGKLRRSIQPEITLTTDAMSDRMHALRPADVITVEEPTVEAVGQFAVAERSQSYYGNRLDTTFSLRELPPSLTDDVDPPSATGGEEEDTTTEPVGGGVASYGEASFGDSSFGGT